MTLFVPFLTGILLHPPYLYSPKKPVFGSSLFVPRSARIKVRVQRPSSDSIVIRLSQVAGGWFKDHHESWSDSERTTDLLLLFWIVKEEEEEEEAVGSLLLFVQGGWNGWFITYLHTHCVYYVIRDERTYLRRRRRWRIRKPSGQWNTPLGTLLHRENLN